MPRCPPISCQRASSRREKSRGEVLGVVGVTGISPSRSTRVKGPSALRLLAEPQPGVWRHVCFTNRRWVFDT
jgi:hypothetical protein